MKANVVMNGMGKMGTAVAEKLLQDENIQIIDVIDPNPSTERGKEIQKYYNLGGELRFLKENFENMAKKSTEKFFNVLVDFTNEKASKNACLTAAKNGINIVSGTTPMARNIEDEISAAIKDNEVYGIRCPNFSVGVQYFLHDMRAMKIDPSDDISVHEIHRVEKKSTSGTAREIAKILCPKAGKIGYILTTEGKVFDKDNNEIAMPEWKKDVLINYVKVSQQRFGDEPGTHIVTVGNEKDFRQYKVRATRESLAEGAYRSVKFLADAAEKGLQPAQYTIEQVLGL